MELFLKSDIKILIIYYECANYPKFIKIFKAVFFYFVGIVEFIKSCDKLGSIIFCIICYESHKYCSIFSLNYSKSSLNTFIIVLIPICPKFMSTLNDN